MVKTVPNTPRFNGFNSWRKYQKDTTQTILDTDKKFSFLSAQTGSGKSIVSMSVADIVVDNADTIYQNNVEEHGDEEKKARAYYLVGTKNLQEQILKDFPDVALLKGRSNYDCIINDVTCDKCAYKYAKKKCPERMACPYNVARQKALESRIVIWNYSMFLATQSFGGSFPDADMIICDEAHMIESILMDFISVKFNHNFFNDVDVTFPFTEDGVIEAITEVGKKAESKFDSLSYGIKEQLEVSDYCDDDDLKLCSKMEKKANRVKFFLSIYDKETWIIDHKESSVTIKPVKVDKFSNRIFKWSDKFLLMSATLPPASVICNNLGINPDTTMYYDVPSTFPPKNRPIYFLPIGKMNKDNWQNAIIDIMDWINKYCEKYKVKILIHTVNNKIRNTLLESKSFAPDYHKFYHNTSEEREEALEDFKQGKAPCMLITPSMENGIDLKGDLCRVQFILKMPYADMGDKQVRARMKIDKHWYTTNTINRLVQATGRIIRAEDDYGKTYIFDSCFTELYAIWNKKFFPKWFKDAVHVRSKNKSKGSK